MTLIVSVAHSQDEVPSRALTPCTVCKNARCRLCYSYLE